MREIKFRAWNKSTKEMNAYVEIYCYKDGSVGYSAGKENNNAVGSTENFVLMQFIGLRDKDKKEIYEGDIIDFWNPGSKEHEFSAIEWDGYSFGIDQRDARLSKVIGNVYENPELLK
jgi:uncharacterized phage protein (TIGR01671 family)